jgi:CRP-like cAMP-binding protein
MDCSQCEGFRKSLFQDLSPELLARLVKGQTAHPYRRHQILFYEDNPATGLHCVHSGRVKLYKADSDGRQYITQLAEPGDVLGLESVFTNATFAETAEMLEDGVVCFMERNTVRALVREEPRFAGRIIEVLAGDVRHADSERVELAYGLVRERLARLLLILFEHHAAGTDEKDAPPTVVFSRQDIAEMIGVAPETAIRLLSELRHERVVAAQGRRLTLIDRERLQAAAGL